MFLTIDVNNFDSEVKKAESPVLLACIHRGYGYKTQAKALDSLIKKFNGTLKVCLLDEDYKNAFKRLGIEGVPTYILFNKSKEKGRILGKVDKKKLSDFITKMMPNFK